MKKELIIRELKLKCPLYEKALKDCPEGGENPNYLSKIQEENLLKLCTTEKHKRCEVFLQFQEQAA